QRRVTLHAIVRSLLLILLALIGLVLAEGLIERFYVGQGPDRRRLGTMRLVLRFVSQLLGVLIILLVLFGPPSQLSTVLALAAAGLTVALKDFIVAFFGWFILMGRHGIRAGDWVEINGIGGEVVEVGLLRTILLETGNWNDAGHPTGRKVSCVNSFAIEGQYFNFSTSGQWLWDEIQIEVLQGGDPYQVAEGIKKIAAEETSANSQQAEAEWDRVVPAFENRKFSAEPSMSVRPSGNGAMVLVRYITRVNERSSVRARIYKAVVELLHSKNLPEAGAG